ncbi:MAG: threonylcarbamoyl-AMP synthase [Actinobacteria bacterium]|nr:threonylcarbamoyl-AMP synthase [Actinomycetota bacterium]
MLIKINSINKTDNKTIEKIAAELTNGKIAILPTSTIYGLSCIYNSSKALERIYEIKQRKKDLPFIVLISKLEHINFLTEGKNKTADKIINKYWLSKKPEPLTLVFKKNKGLNNFATGSKDTIALRLDSLALIRKIIDICGPLVSTSATISGTALSPKNIEEIPQKIKNKVDLIVDYGANLSGIASTILDVTGNKPVIIREGRLKFEDIKEKMKIYLF